MVVVDEVLGQWVTLAGTRRTRLEELLGGLHPVPPFRYLEALAGARTLRNYRRALASSRTIWRPVYTERLSCI